MLIYGHTRRVRFPTNADGAPTFSTSDIFFMNDGGRPGWGRLHVCFIFIPCSIVHGVQLPLGVVHNPAGHHNQLSTLKAGDDAIQKCEKVLTVIYSEESIAKRKEKNRQLGAIKQTESIYMLMCPTGCRVMKKARLLVLMYLTEVFRVQVSSN
jgi:hypothetical protein